MPMAASQREASRTELPGSSRKLSAAGMSAGLHAGLLLALILAIVSRHHTTPPMTSFTMGFAPAPAQVTTLPEMRIGEPDRRAQVSALLPVTPRLVARPAAARFDRGPPRARLAPNISPAPLQPPAITAPVKPAAQPHAVIRPEALTGLETRIRRAVQDAALYPASARLKHREGRAQVAFDYADGAASEIALAASSHTAMLDRAALDAVRRAAMPHAPAEIGARRLALLVWVDFSLATD